MGRSRQHHQWLKNLVKSKPDTILGKPFDDVNQFYTINNKLGTGNFGVTYLCTEKSTGKAYACKSIPKRKKMSKADEKDIKREIQIMQILNGKPNIVGFKGAYEDNDWVHIVMDLCEGGELAARIRAKERYNECDAAKLCKQIVEAVRACHSMGVIHRDLKPQNLLFSSDRKKLKLADFGVSVFMKKGKCEDSVGTAPYMAPEVIEGRYGKEADIWSAGVILYFSLSGLLPFRALTEEGIYNAILRGHIDLERHPWPSISDTAKDLVRKMLTRDPRKRVTSAQVLEHPWIIKYGDKRKSRMKKLALTVIKKLKELKAQANHIKEKFRMAIERRERLGRRGDDQIIIDQENHIRKLAKRYRSRKS